MSHCCKAPRDAEHAGGFGAAIEDCTEDEAGRFVVDNGEYRSFVNFCPFCGERAPSAIPIKPEVTAIAATRG